MMDQELVTSNLKPLKVFGVTNVVVGLMCLSHVDSYCLQTPMRVLKRNATHLIQADPRISTRLLRCIMLHNLVVVGSSQCTNLFLHVT